MAFLRKEEEHDGAGLRAKTAFRTNEPKLLPLQQLYKYLINNNLRIKKTCAQENSTMKNEPKKREG
jgi:hypothetical protein